VAKWKFERRQGACSQCERAFADGERLISTLALAHEGLARLDFCPECFDPEAAQAVFWWRTRHEENKRKTVQLDLESLERLFVELEGREEVTLREIRYVLCLLLMRKRKLKVERIQRTAEGESFVVKRPRRDQRFEVFVYDFTPERMAELRGELQGIFDGGEETGELPGEDAGSDESEASGPEAAAEVDAGAPEADATA